MFRFIILHRIYSFLIGLCLLLFTTSCSEKTDTGDHSENTEHAEHEETYKEGDHEKMVHLSVAQFVNAGIDTGWFELKNLSEVINANGYTKLPPQNQAEVSVQFPGTIQSIKVIEGQYVKKGQTLATLQSLAYNNMRLEREKLSQELKSAEANIAFLKLEYQRQKELSDQNVTAKKILQKVSSELQMEESKIKALNNQVSILGQNIRIGGSSGSPVISIVAPISGNITDIDVTIGSSAEEGKPLFHIVDNSQMHVDLLVYEKDLFKVKPGQKVRFILTNQNNEEIPGEIFGIGQAFENETKSVAVHATIDNKLKLIPGMYVNALIDIGASQVQALPVDAIINAEGKEFIFVLEAQQHASGEDTGHNEKDGHVHSDEEPAHGEEGHQHESEEAESHSSKEAEHEVAFARIEVKTGVSQLGYVQVTPLTEIHPGDKIVVKGAYYLQSHLLKSEGGGGHQH